MAPRLRGDDEALLLNGCRRQLVQRDLELASRRQKNARITGTLSRPMFDQQKLQRLAFVLVQEEAPVALGGPNVGGHFGKEFHQLCACARSYLDQGE